MAKLHFFLLHFPSLHNASFLHGFPSLLISKIKKLNTKKIQCYLQGNNLHQLYSLLQPIFSVHLLYCKPYAKFNTQRHISVNKKNEMYCLEDLGYQLGSLKLLFIPRRLEIQGRLVPGSCQSTGMGVRRSIDESSDLQGTVIF